MFIDPASLRNDPAKIEEVEKASARLVAQAVYEFRQTAAEIFAREKDLAQDIAEDITREALDRLGVSRMDLRLFGKIDYKRARYVFHPEYAVRQALFVDSKAEKESGTATLQTAQTSLRIRHVRSGADIDVAGELPAVVESEKGNCLTTSMVVKYHYSDEPVSKLLAIIVAAVPNGMLQNVYNPSAADTIWRTGRNAPTLGEVFRVRLVFSALKSKMKWRVQNIQVPDVPSAPQPGPTIASGGLPSGADVFPWDE
jgi:hypothetical protein